MSEIVSDNEEFVGIAKKLNVDNVSETLIKEDEVTPQVSNFDAVTDDNFEIVDDVYIANELKDLISKTKKVQGILMSSLKKSSEPRAYEVFSDLANTIIMATDKLLNTSKAVVDAKSLKLKKKVIDLRQVENNSIAITPQQLTAMINAAKENTQLKEIDAKFVIDNTEFKDEEGI